MPGDILKQKELRSIRDQFEVQPLEGTEFHLRCLVSWYFPLNHTSTWLCGGKRQAQCTFPMTPRTAQWTMSCVGTDIISGYCIGEVGDVLDLNCNVINIELVLRW